MESLGIKLKEAREKKGYTFDQISRDTNIARRYLEALESEDFDVFPGEPYLLGFLRNYADHLGLSSQDLVASYRSAKIQEQPIPVEQLLKDTSPSIPLKVVVPVAIAAVAVVGIVLAVVLSGSGSGSGGDDAAQARVPVEYKLESGFIEKRFYTGDSALVTLGTEKFQLQLSKLAEGATLTSPSGDLALELGQEGKVDLNGDGVMDLTVFVADLFKNNPSKGVSLRFELTGPAPSLDAAAVGTPGTPGAPGTPAVPGAPAVPGQVAGATGPVSSPIIFSSSGSAYPFTLQATFKGYCMFRWETDRKDRQERYFHKADVQNIQAQNGIRLWVSNAGAVKLVAIGGGKSVDVELGGSGEVVVVDVKWVKDVDGRMKLTTVKLE